MKIRHLPFLLSAPFCFFPSGPALDIRWANQGLTRRPHDGLWIWRNIYVADLFGPGRIYRLHLCYAAQTVRRFGDHQKRHPLDILRKRYAEGDITKEEFENLKKDIEK